jgi:hypothetical protein
MEGMNFFMCFLHLFHFVCWIDHNSIHLVIVGMNIDVCGCYGLHLSLRSISEVGSQVNGQILLLNFEVGDCSEHSSIIVHFCTWFILQSYDLETLTANMASVHWTLSYEVEHLLMCM